MKFEYALINLGILAIFVIVVGFFQSAIVKKLDDIRANEYIRTVVVTPTVAPTATPSAALKPVTRIYTPASATAPAVKK